MGSAQDSGPPLTPEGEALMRQAITRCAGILRVYWQHHDPPPTVAERWAQAQGLVAQFYPPGYPDRIVEEV